MIGARIEDGNLLVVEEDEDPPDGTVVVVLLRNGDEATVKRLYREGTRSGSSPTTGSSKIWWFRPRTCGCRGGSFTGSIRPTGDEGPEGEVDAQPVPCCVTIGSLELGRPRRGEPP